MDLNLEIGALIVFGLLAVFNAGVAWATLQMLKDWKPEVDRRLLALEQHSGGEVTR